jgi:hypothetical protein
MGFFLIHCAFFEGNREFCHLVKFARNLGGCAFEEIGSDKLLTWSRYRHSIKPVYFCAGLLLK